MPTHPIKPLPATDSAAELHELIGDDATATFENNPTFIESNPTGSASSENLEEQRPGAGEEFQAQAAKTEDEDDEDDDDDEEDVEDGEDEDDLDEDEEDDDYEDDDDEDEEDDEDDEDDAVEASATSGSPKLWADGLLGYEDEADDAKKGVDRVTGDVDRERAQGRDLTDDPDENPEDAYAEVNPEEEREEEADSDVLIRPVKQMDFSTFSSLGA